MPTEILKYCLIALLSQDAEQQAAELEALLNNDFEQTQLAACLRAHGEELSEDIGEFIMGTMTAGGADQPDHSKKKQN